MANVKKYLILGGPLDGQYANQKDFYRLYVSTVYSQDAGQFEPWRLEYTMFNAGSRNGSPTSMVFIHHSLLKPPIRAKQHPGP